jgi:hypothetical protein
MSPVCIIRRVKGLASDTKSDATQVLHWDEVVPFVLFAIRETIQESLGFRPADLVFGHTQRGPLKILKALILSPTPSSALKNVLDYVSKMQERLHAACA